MWLNDYAVVSTSKSFTWNWWTLLFINCISKKLTSNISDKIENIIYLSCRDDFLPMWKNTYQNTISYCIKKWISNPERFSFMYEVLMKELEIKIERVEKIWKICLLYYVSIRYISCYPLLLLYFKILKQNNSFKNEWKEAEMQAGRNLGKKSTVVKQNINSQK